MKITNFELTKTTGNSYLNYIYHALVDVETGMLWWKKTNRLEVQKPYAGFWIFVETGKFTPNVEVETLARSWTAKTGEAC